MIVLILLLPINPKFSINSQQNVTCIAAGTDHVAVLFKLFMCRYTSTLLNPIKAHFLAVSIYCTICGAVTFPANMHQVSLWTSCPALQYNRDQISGFTCRWFAGFIFREKPNFGFAQGGGPYQNF
jgi:hypothetical protein